MPLTASCAKTLTSLDGDGFCKAWGVSSSWRKEISEGWALRLIA